MAPIGDSVKGFDVGKYIQLQDKTLDLTGTRVFIFSFLFVYICIVCVVLLNLLLLGKYFVGFDDTLYVILTLTVLGAGFMSTQGDFYVLEAEIKFYPFPV